jgi:hypothetical protein
MEACTDFILHVTHPPNPNRPLTNVRTPNQEAGRPLFDRVNCGMPQTDQCMAAGHCPIRACSGCHAIDPSGNPQSAVPGFFGTTGNASFDFAPQFLKVPHLRNV